MYVLSEEQYNRLKLQQKVSTVVVVDEESHSSDIVQPPPPQTPTVHYTCPICGKSYKQKRDLRRHVKLTHAPPTKVIIPPTVETNIIEKKIKEKKPKKKRTKRLKVFDKVRKWMTIHD